MREQIIEIKLPVEATVGARVMSAIELEFPGARIAESDGDLRLVVDADTTSPSLSFTKPLIVDGDLLASLRDGGECYFDHHGGCQAHGYLSLEPGEMCPQQELKNICEANSL